MSVSNGQLANQTTFNSAFISRSVDSDTTGKVGLKNATSGAVVANAQKLLNELCEAVGTTEGDAARNNYSSHIVIADGDSRKTAIEKLDAKLGDPISHTTLTDTTTTDSHPATAVSVVATSFDGILNNTSTEVQLALAALSNFNKTTNFAIKDATDLTKILRVALDVATATTRTLTMPDADVNLSYVRAIMDGLALVGNGTAGDKYVYFNNADVLKPGIRYNDSLNKTQYSNDGIVWNDIGSGSGGGGGGGGIQLFQETPGGSVNGVNVDFVLTQEPLNDEHVAVFVNGLLLQDTEWTRSGLTITLSEAPAIAQSVYVIYSMAAATSFKQEVLTGLVDGINTNYELSQTPTTSESIFLTLNGLLQKQGEYSVSGTTISFTTAPALGSTVYAFYEILAIPSGSTVNNKVEYVTLSGGDITNKQISLSQLPLVAGNVMVDMIHGCSQEYAVDYVVSGSVLSWNGLALESLLIAGDKLRIAYQY